MGETGGGCHVIPTSPLSATPSVLVLPAISCHLPDFIMGDLSLVFTTDLSKGLLTISETLRKAYDLFVILARSQFSEPRSPGLGAWGWHTLQERAAGIGNGMFLPACPWTSELVWPSLGLRVSETCPGVSGRAGWPEHTYVPGERRDPGRHGRILSGAGKWPGKSPRWGGGERELRAVCGGGSIMLV